VGCPGRVSTPSPVRAGQRRVGSSPGVSGGWGLRLRAAAAGGGCGVGVDAAQPGGGRRGWPPFPARCHHAQVPGGRGCGRCAGVGAGRAAGGSAGDARCQPRVRGVVVAGCCGDAVAARRFAGRRLLLALVVALVVVRMASVSVGLMSWSSSLSLRSRDVGGVAAAGLCALARVADCGAAAGAAAVASGPWPARQRLVAVGAAVLQTRRDGVAQPAVLPMAGRAAVAGRSWGRWGRRGCDHVPGRGLEVCGVGPSSGTTAPESTRAAQASRTARRDSALARVIPLRVPPVRRTAPRRFCRSASRVSRVHRRDGWRRRLPAGQLVGWGHPVSFRGGLPGAPAGFVVGSSAGSGSRSCPRTGRTGGRAGRVTA
jgi:hypothetical protein